jgi:hypothetical protein
MPVIPGLGRRRQEGLEFKPSLSYLRLCLKKKKKKRGSLGDGTSKKTCSSSPESM